jgi:type IV secretion system protein VirB9
MTPAKFLAAAAVISCLAAAAQEVPIGSPGDPRVRYITYRTDRSVVIRVRRGVATRIILDRTEKIQAHGTGFPSRCSVEADEWCIRAAEGESQVWIKPKSGATHNNLELATDKRDYSIKLEVLPDAPKGEAAADEVFRAIFVYPTQDSPSAGAAAAIAGADAGAAAASPVAVRAAGNLAAFGCARPWRVVNTNFSRDDAADLAPVRIFDDGARTIFVFGDAAPLPAVFAVGEDHAESRVNFSVDGNCLVVHQLGRQFVLRAGKAVLNVFNDSYVAGASSPNLRALRERREVQQ